MLAQHTNTGDETLAVVGRRLVTVETPGQFYRRKVLDLKPGMLLSWLRKFTCDSQPLDDLLQEIYEKLLRVDEARAAAIRSVPNYAFGIARHVAYDWAHRRRASPIDYLPSPEQLTATDPRKDVERSVLAQQEIKLLLHEISRLPEQCRKVLVLVKVLGHSAKEAAVHLGIAESTVKKQLQIAAVRCQNALEEGCSRPGLRLLCKLVRRKGVQL